MAIWTKELKWNPFPIMDSILTRAKHLGYGDSRGNEIKPNLGFADDGRQAFILEMYKGAYSVRVILQNEEEKIIISTGTLENNVVIDIKTEKFGLDKQSKASTFLERVMT